jgi:hypothetical protein
VTARMNPLLFFATPRRELRGQARRCVDERLSSRMITLGSRVEQSQLRSTLHRNGPARGRCGPLQAMNTIVRCGRSLGEAVAHSLTDGVPW